MIPLLKAEFLELNLELVSCWLLQYFVYHLSLKIAHFAELNIQRYCHFMPFDKKLACLANYQERRSFPWPLVVFICLDHSSLQSFTFSHSHFLDIIWINKYESYFRIPFWLFKGTQYVVSHFECKLLLVAPAIKWHNFQSISQHKIAVMPSIWVIIGDTISNLWWMPNTVSRGLGFAAMSASEMILTKTAHPCQFQVQLLLQNCWMSSTRISQELHNTFKFVPA